MKDRYYLLFEGDSSDDIQGGYLTRQAAIDAYKDVTDDLGRFGQLISATIHIAPSAAETVEDPDFYLTLGPRGGVRCEKG